MKNKLLIALAVILLTGTLFAKSGFHIAYALENPGQANNNGFMLGWHTEPKLAKYIALDFHSNFAFSTFENTRFSGGTDDVYHFHTMIMLGPKGFMTFGKLEPFVSIGGLFSFMAEYSDSNADYFVGGGIFVKFGLDINFSKKFGIGFEIEYAKPWGKDYNTRTVLNPNDRITNTIQDIMTFGIRLNY